MKLPVETPPPQINKYIWYAVMMSLCWYISSGTVCIHHRQMRIFLNNKIMCIATDNLNKNIIAVCFTRKYYFRLFTSTFQHQLISL